MSFIVYERGCWVNFVVVVMVYVKMMLLLKKCFGRGGLNLFWLLMVKRSWVFCLSGMFMVCVLVCYVNVVSVLNVEIFCMVLFLRIVFFIVFKLLGVRMKFLYMRLLFMRSFLLERFLILLNLWWGNFILGGFWDCSILWLMWGGWVMLILWVSFFYVCRNLLVESLFII